MFKSNRKLVCDLGASSLKLVEFEKNGSDGLKLISYSVAELERIEGNRDAYLTRVLSDLMQKNNITPGPVAITVSGRSIFTRFVDCPPAEKEKLEKIVRYEAIQNVPFPIDEVVWDYHLVSRSEDAVRIMLAAIKSEIAESICHIAEMAGLEPVMVDVAPLSLYNAIHAAGMLSEDSALILDIGDRSTDMIFTEGGKVFFRTAPVGGSSITKAIAKEHNISFQEAESLKLENPKEVQKEINTWKTRLLGEVKRSITYYQSHYDGSKPTRVCLTGGVACLDDLDSFFKDKLNLPVDSLDLLKNIDLSETLDRDSLKRDARRLGSLFGAARQMVGDCPVKIDLMPIRIRKKDLNRRKRPFLFGAAILVLGLFMGLGYYFSVKVDLAAREQQGIESSLKSLSRIENSMQRTESEISSLESKIDKLFSLFDERVRVYNFLDEIRNLMPDGTSITSLQPIYKVAGMASETNQYSGSEVNSYNDYSVNDSNLHPEGLNLKGFRIAGFGYLDVIDPSHTVRALLEDLKALPSVSKKTKIVKQPLPGEFAQQFVIEIDFKEPAKI